MGKITLLSQSIDELIENDNLVSIPLNNMEWYSWKNVQGSCRMRDNLINTNHIEYLIKKKNLEE